MKRQHIAIFPAPGNGHVNPVLGLIVELVKRGYRVTCPTIELYAEKIRESGAEPILFRPPAFPNGEDLGHYFNLTSASCWTMNATIGYPFMLLTAAVGVAQLEGIYLRDRPDAILYDRTILAGRIIARRLDCPAIQIYPHFAYCGNSILRANGICGNPPAMMAFSPLMDIFLSVYGIDDRESLWHTEDLNIYFIPREFQYHGDSFDRRTCFVGPCLNRPVTPTWKNNSNGKPIVLVSDVGGVSDMAYFNMFKAAFSDSRYHVIFSIGDAFPVEILQDLPGNFEVNTRASHLEILPHAAISICQAGMGTTLEALHFGVPLIALPVSPYHEEVAYRIAELGVGIHLDRSAATSDLIRESTRKALADNSLMHRVTKMQNAVRASGGASLAADEIQSFLGLCDRD